MRGASLAGECIAYERAILESLPFVAWVKDTAGRFVVVNRRFAESTGYDDPADVVGKTDFDFSTRELAEHYRADDRQVMESGTARLIEEPVILDGREAWRETYKAPVRDVNGTLLGSFGFVRDIDSHKRAETLLTLQRDLGIALAEVTETAGAYVALVEHAVRVPGVQSAGVYEASRDRDFVLRVHQGLSDGFVERTRVMPFAVPEVQAFYHERTLRNWQDFSPALQSVLADEGLRAVVVIPIRQGGEVRGCLNLASRTRDRIEDDAVLALEAMCVHFGHVIDRLQAEEALRASEARWQFALEGAGDGVWDWDVPSGRVFYSRRWKEMLGYAEHEIGGTYDDWASRVHPDDFPRVAPASGHSLAESRGFATEHRLRRKDGTYIWVLDRGRVVEHDAAGAPTRVIGIQTDISERKRAETALRESEEFLRDVVESTSDGILVEDGHGRTLTANARFAQMWRIGEELVASGDETAMRRYVLDQLESPETFEGKVLSLRGTSAESFDLLTFKDGRCFERYSSALLRDGAVAGRVWSFRDVTEKRRSDLLFRSVIASTPDAFIAFDEHLRVVDWSPQAEQLFGWEAAEIVGCELTGTLLPPDVAAKLAAGLGRFVSTGRSSFVGRVRRQTALRKDGSEFPAELQVGASRIGGEWRFSGFVRDVTERVLADERLAQAEKLEAIGQLTGGLAHDFNNLLGIVIGTLDLLEDAESDEERAELLGSVREAAHRGAGVTSALLAIARRQQLSPSRADLNALVRDLTPLLRHTAGKRVSLSIELGEGIGLSQVDHGGFNNALLNLVINARDAMTEGGQILVRTGVASLGPDAPAPLQEGRYHLVEVRDTGIGMPPEVAARAFDPFFTTKGRGKGTGLGLAMVYGFARQSGGTAVIRSAVGRGTSVEIYLPIAVDEAALQAAQEPPPEAVASGGRERVLLLDDEPALVRVGSRWLKELGYGVVGVTDAEEALRLLETEPFDALVSDVIMPGLLDGVAVASAAERVQPGLAIMLVSGYPEGLVEKIHGRWPLLDKPFTRSQLDATLRKALRRRSAGRR